MKKLLLIFICINTSAFIIDIIAQVGINTNNPKGIFHIDPQKNSPTNTSDDVIFTNKGFLGLGTINPTAQLHINVPNNQSPLKIVDGNQSEGKTILSDANGIASWGTMRGKGGTVYELAATKYPKGVQTPMNIGESTTYTTTSSGNYLFIIRLWGQTSATNGYAANCYFTLNKNGTQIDRVEYYIPVLTTSTRLTCSVALVAIDAQKGDELQIVFWPKAGDFTTFKGTYQSTTVTVFMM